MRTSVRRTLCATAIAGGFTVLGIAFAASSATAAQGPDTTSGVSGLVSGNQTGGGIQAPLDTSGNQVTVIGDGNKNSSTDSGTGSTVATGSGSSGGDRTSGQDSIGSGNQTDARAVAPVEASGNQVTVIGDGNTVGREDTSNGGTTDSSTGGNTTSGQDGTGSGNQTDTTALVPVDASGNQVTVIGDGNTAESTTDGDTAGPGDPAEGSEATPGNESSPGVDGSDEGAANGTGSATAASAGAGAQAAPAAAIVGVLPQTGASTGLMLWALLGLTMLLLGSGLMTGRRGVRTGRQHSQGVAQAL